MTQCICKVLYIADSFWSITRHSVLPKALGCLADERTFSSKSGLIQYVSILLVNEQPLQLFLTPNPLQLFLTPNAPLLSSGIGLNKTLLGKPGLMVLLPLSIQLYCLLCCFPLDAQQSCIQGIQDLLLFTTG